MLCLRLGSLSYSDLRGRQVEITCILNNNVIVQLQALRLALLAMGCGIGFCRSAGETLDPSLVDCIFYLCNSDLQEHFSSQLNVHSYAILAVRACFIAEAASQLKQCQHAALHVSLVAHIYHAQQRTAMRQLISNSLILAIEN